jgi:peptidyl-prolyl cis-trans isomerase A (cyclophilin A)
VTRRRLAPPVFASFAGLLLVACGGKKALSERAPDQFKARLQTTKGDVVILVHRDWSPLGADHFYELTKIGFYNNVAFFRVVKGFIIQWGINGDPKVNHDWSEITIKDDPPKVSNKIGTVTFAKTGEPNTRSTQLFVNLGDNSGSLDSQGFTPFGEVIQGLENIMHVDGEYGEQPSQPAIAETGNPYLEEHFPRLDYVKKTTILP